jgi:uncharacterized membrane protein
MSLSDKMFLHFLLVALIYLPISALARPAPHVFHRQYLENPPIESHSLSVEAIVGIIAIIVAILGIALPLIWPSLRTRLDPRRRRSRFRLSSTTSSTLFPTIC